MNSDSAHQPASPATQRSLTNAHPHPYVALKAGFIDFRLSTSLLPYSDIASAIFGLHTSN